MAFRKNKTLNTNKLKTYSRQMKLLKLMLICALLTGSQYAHSEDFFDYVAPNSLLAPSSSSSQYIPIAPHL